MVFFRTLFPTALSVFSLSFHFNPLCKTITEVKPHFRQKRLQHLVFPSGLPSKPEPSPMLFNYGIRTRTGAFNMVGLQPMFVESSSFLSLTSNVSPKLRTFALSKYFSVCAELHDPRSKIGQQMIFAVCFPI